MVPDFGDDKLNSSSMILADVMEKVPAKSVGAGSFVIGDEKVRPRVDPADGKPASFKRDQRLNLWMQIYNLASGREDEEAFRHRAVRSDQRCRRTSRL